MADQDEAVDETGRAYTFAIVGVGTALVVTLIGASTIAALGHQVPKELWAIGGALSGALVGILVQAPRLASGGEATPAAAGYKTHNAAVEAARSKAAEIVKAAGATPEQMAGVRVALQRVERQGAELKTKLTSTATVTAANEGGQAHRAAADAVQLQRVALEEITTKANESPRRPGTAGRKGSARSRARSCVEGRAGGGPARTGLVCGGEDDHGRSKDLRSADPVRRGAGAWGATRARRHPRPAVPPESKNCSYYAGTTKQAANALIALASAAGGALLGVFATSPGASKAAKARAGRGSLPA